MSQDQFIWKTSSYSMNGSGQCVEVGWRTSSYSANGGGQCVEAGAVLDGSGRMAVRDSKARQLGYLTVPNPEWVAFLHSVKSGEV